MLTDKELLQDVVKAWEADRAHEEEITQKWPEFNAAAEQARGPSAMYLAVEAIRKHLQDPSAEEWNDSAPSRAEVYKAISSVVPHSNCLVRDALKIR